MLSGRGVASPRETDLDGTWDDSQFFSAESKEAFAVTERLAKNVNFWIRIDSYYGINQGLVHDAKYVDIVYEVINLDNPTSRTGDADQED